MGILGPCRLSQFEPLTVHLRLHLQDVAEKRCQGESLDSGDRSNRPRAHASGAENARVGVVPGSSCQRCAMRPMFSRQTIEAAQLWPLYTTTSGGVLRYQIFDDEARAAMESRPEGHDVCRGVRWWRAAGITAAQAEGFNALGERLRVRVPPGRLCLGQFGRDPENHYFLKTKVPNARRLLWAPKVRLTFVTR